MGYPILAYAVSLLPEAAPIRFLDPGIGTSSFYAALRATFPANRHGLVVGGAVTRAGGTAERAAALEMIARHLKPGRWITLGSDKAYDVADFVRQLRGRT